MPKPPLSLRQRFGYLPASLVMVLEVAGEQAMFDLVRTLGGKRLSLGRRPGLHHPLTLAVGLDAAQTIQQTFYSNHIPFIDVPLMAHAHLQAKQNAIRSMRHQGATIAQIAKAYAMTERGIYLALSRTPPPPNPQQLSLPLS
jgi:hypothetical protein